MGFEHKYVDCHPVFVVLPYSLVHLLQDPGYYTQANAKSKKKKKVSVDICQYFVMYYYAQFLLSVPVYYLYLLFRGHDL